MRFIPFKFSSKYFSLFFIALLIVFFQFSHHDDSSYWGLTTVDGAAANYLIGVSLLFLLLIIITISQKKSLRPYRPFFTKKTFIAGFILSMSAAGLNRITINTATDKNIFYRDLSILELLKDGQVDEYRYVSTEMIYEGFILFFALFLTLFILIQVFISFLPEQRVQSSHIKLPPSPSNFCVGSIVATIFISSLFTAFKGGVLMIVLVGLLMLCTICVYTFIWFLWKYSKKLRQHSISY